MIELTDITLIEANGRFAAVHKLMANDGALNDWMLISSAHIATPSISSQFLLHLWNDGRIVIFDAVRPMEMETPVDDLNELLTWSKNNGWKGIWVDDRMIMTKKGLHYWGRIFLSGLVENETLRQRDEEEHERLSKAYLKEKAEENENAS